MKTLKRIRDRTNPEWARDLHVIVAAGHERYRQNRHMPAGPHSVGWWLLVGWWLMPPAWVVRALLWLMVWPVGLRRSLADQRLRQERAFWRAVARTSR
jgi:hypothetical protein